MAAARLRALCLMTALLSPAIAWAEGRGVIDGFVFDTSGAPLAAVEIRYLGAVVATSDEDGYFRLDVPVGRPTLVFRAPGREPQTSPPIPVSAGAATEIILVYRDSGVGAFDLEAPTGPAPDQVDDVDLPKTEVSGRVVNKDGAPVEGARIVARGTSADARTDADGRFTVLLPVGSWTLTIIHPNHATAQAPVTVESIARPPAEIQVEVEERVATLTELIVTAPQIEGAAVYVLKERQEASTVTDILGADQISKAGDSDAASALARVTGVTIVDGRFVYVRGLGPRYSTVLMNGSVLPSPEPNLRVVPLDLFPASFISSLTVQKNFSPDMPGEFGGGIIDIETKDIPDEFEASLSVSVGGRTGSTFQEGPRYDGTPSDWLGFGIPGRAVPQPVRDAASNNLLIRDGDLLNPELGFSPGELERLGESFGSDYGIGTQTIIPDLGTSGSIGTAFDIFGGRGGASVAFDYGNKWLFLDPLQNRNYQLSGGELTLRESFDLQRVQNEVALSVLAGLGLDINPLNSLRLTSTINRISTNQTSFGTGIARETSLPQETRVFRWVERMLWTTQLKGEHTIVPLARLELDYRYMFSIAFRDEPNRREQRRDSDPTTGEFFYSADQNQRFYSELDDQNHDGGLDLTLPVNLFEKLRSDFKIGTAFTVKDRDVLVRRLQYREITGRIPPEEAVFRRFSPVGTLFQPDYISSNFLEITELTRIDDNYVGKAELFAGYAMADLNFPHRIRLTGGVRGEQSNQRITIVDPVNREPIDISDELFPDLPEGRELGELERFDLMPSALITWEFVENMQIRAGYSRTVNRPSLRELSPAPFIDVTSGRQYKGNPLLDRAIIDNIDLRWEWYPSPGESVSIAGFVKLFDQPIEFQQTIGAGIIEFSPINSERAQNIGVEFEFRKSSDFLATWTNARWMADFYFAANLTVVWSEVELPEDTQLTNTERPLQGQSPYVVNAQLGYENLDSGTNATLLFNIFGERIRSVGILGIPDVYEQPRPMLDFVFRQRIGLFDLSAKVKNMLNSVNLETVGQDRDGLVFTRFRKGVEFSVGLGFAL